MVSTSAKPVLVTGATGFVGTAVARALIATGRPVRALCRPNRDRRNLAGLDLEIAEGSLEDARSLAAGVAGCGALYHVAADYRLWVRDPTAMYRANVEGTRALMTAALAAGVERVVYTSSVATLGLHGDGTPADETTPSTLDDMVGPYKRSKFLAEVEVHRLVERRQLPAVIVHPSTPIGPRDIKPTPTGRIIVEAASGRMPAFVDTGLNLVHVDDVAAGHIAALQRGRIGERYILGGENVRLATMLADIAEIVHRRPPRLRFSIAALYPIALGAEWLAGLTGKEPFAPRDGLRMARHYMFFNAAKARRELDYTSRPYLQAIADPIAWFNQAGYVP